MLDMAAFPWTSVVVIGTIIVGLAIAYGMWHTRNRSARQVARTEAATHDLYKRTDRELRE